MNIRRWPRRLLGKYRRIRSAQFQKRPYRMASQRPIISFTFDDIPRSAFTVGGAILRTHGVRGTYYVSLKLMDTTAVQGKLFSRKDLESIVADGHELGCHTHEHLDAWKTGPRQFEASLRDNQRVLSGLFPGRHFRTFSYPISDPRPRTKKIAGKHFLCSRGGGQAYNSGLIDLNLLKAYFLDERNRGNTSEIRTLIEHNRQERGWLIFATHDIGEAPSPFGFSPRLFEEVVRNSVDSGAVVVPVLEAIEMLMAQRLFPPAAQE